MLETFDIREKEVRALEGSVCTNVYVSRCLGAAAQSPASKHQCGMRKEKTFANSNERIRPYNLHRASASLYPSPYSKHRRSEFSELLCLQTSSDREERLES